MLITQLPADMLAEVQLPPQIGMSRRMKHALRRLKAIGPPIGEPIEGLLRQSHSQSFVWTRKPGQSFGA